MEATSFVPKPQSPSPYSHFSPSSPSPFYPRNPTHFPLSSLLRRDFFGNGIHCSRAPVPQFQRKSKKSGFHQIRNPKFSCQASLENQVLAIFAFATVAAIPVYLNYLKRERDDRASELSDIRNLDDHENHSFFTEVKSVTNVEQIMKNRSVHSKIETCITDQGMQSSVKVVKSVSEENAEDIIFRDNLTSSNEATHLSKFEANLDTEKCKKTANHSPPSATLNEAALNPENSAIPEFLPRVFQECSSGDSMLQRVIAESSVNGSTYEEIHQDSELKLKRAQEDELQASNNNGFSGEIVKHPNVFYGERCPNMLHIAIQNSNGFSALQRPQSIQKGADTSSNTEYQEGRVLVASGKEDSPSTRKQVFQRTGYMERKHTVQRGDRVVPKFPGQTDVHVKNKKDLSEYLRIYDRWLREGRLIDCIELLESLEAKGLLDMDKVYHARFFKTCESQKAVKEAFRFVKLISNPTLSTFNMLLSVCACTHDSDGAFQVLPLVKEVGLRADCKLYTTLISTCAKSGKVDAMFKIAQFRGKIGRFGDLTAQTAVGIMNPGFFLNPRFQYEEGFVYSDNIRSGVTKVIERLAPNVTFAIEATREACTGVCRFRTNGEGEENSCSTSHINIPTPTPSNERQQHDVELVDNVVAELVNHHDTVTGRKVFHEMVNAGVEPNVHTYGALIDGCARAGQVAKAFGAYGIMSSKKVKPDRVVFNALITACGQSGAVDRAFDVLAEMRAEPHSLEPDHVTIGAVMKTCSQAGQVDRALEVYKMIHRYNIKGTPDVYTIAVHSCSQKGDLEFALSVYNDMKRNGVVPDEVFFSALIDVAGHAGKVNIAFKILQDAKSQGMQLGNVSYSSLMGACSNAKNWQRALELFEDIKAAKLLPTVSTLNALLTALCDGEQLQKAKDVLGEMRKIGVCPNTITYSILLVACEKKDEVELGFELLSQAKKDGVVPNHKMCKCFTGLCLRRFEKAASLGEPILSFNSGNAQIDNQWTSWSLMVYRETIAAGVVPTMEIFSQVLGCLRLPYDSSLRNRLIENLGVNADSSRWSKIYSLLDGFGEYDPRSFSLLEEAASLGIVPCVSFKQSPIVVDAREFEIHTVEVYILTILRGLKHRLAAGAKLPNVTILVPVEKTQIESSRGDKTINLAGRVGQAVSALLRRLGLPFQGNESFGKIRISGLAIKRWFQPKLASPYDSKPPEFNPSPARLAKGITEQQRKIRINNLSQD